MREVESTETLHFDAISNYANSLSQKMFTCWSSALYILGRYDESRATGMVNGWSHLSTTASA